MRATFGREPGPCISLGANREQNRKIGEASYIAFLCFESRIPLSGRFGHVFQPSLSLWTAWRVCNSELTIPFSHVGVASHKSHRMTSQCIM